MVAGGVFFLIGTFKVKGALKIHALKIKYYQKSKEVDEFENGC
jgi:hypothetical protein